MSTRSEYNTIAHHLRKTPSYCANCGASADIEYHHIVPLANGGTNALSNIVPLCASCHQKAHGSLWHRTPGVHYGRKKKDPPEGYEEVLADYFASKIGKREMMERLGLTDHRTSGTWWIKKYREEHGIPEDYRNNVDVMMWRYRK